MIPARRGPLALTASCVAIFWPGAFAFGLPGIMAPHWQEAFGVGRAAVGACMFFLLAGVGCFMYLAGRWQLRVGVPRMVAAGAVLTGGSAAILAWAPSMAAVYFWAFFCGMAQSFIYVPALTTVQQWFPARRGLVSGLASLVFAGSAAVCAPILAWLLHSHGYITANLALGAGTVVCGLLAAPFMAPPQTPPAAPGQAPMPQEPPSMSPGAAMGTRSFWFMWGAVALMGAAGISMVTLAMELGDWRGLSAARAVSILVAFNLASGISRLLLGWLSDVFNRTRIMGLSFWAAGFAYLLLPWLEGFWALALLAAVVGLAFGALWSVAPPLVGDVFGPKHFGEIFGLLFTAYGFVSGLLGPALAGYLLDAWGSHTLVLCFLGVASLGAGVLIMRVRPATAKNLSG